MFGFGYDLRNRYDRVSTNKGAQMPIPEDRFTNTVADAAAYEAYRSRDDDDYGDDDDYDRYDAEADEDEDDDEDEYCDCGDVLECAICGG